MIYAIGGQAKYQFDSPGQVAFVEAYDPDTDSWSTKSPMPLALSFFATIAVNGKIYVIGGRFSELAYSSNVLEYDPITDTWQNIIFSSQARYAESGVTAYEGQIFLIGGDNHHQSGSKNRFEIFNPASKSWSQAAALMLPASQMQAHVISESIVVPGGSQVCHHLFDPIAQKVVQLYSIADSSWQFVEEMPEPRLGYASAIVANKLYVFGGASKRTGLTGATIHANTYEFTPPTSVTNVAGNRSAQPKEFALQQNYPNPFNPSTNIMYSMLTSDLVTLKVYDRLGKEIQTLVHEFQQRGNYSIQFDASDLSSGIYFYRLQVGSDFRKTKKMVLVR